MQDEKEKNYRWENESLKRDIEKMNEKSYNQIRAAVFAGLFFGMFWNKEQLPDLLPINTTTLKVLGNTFMNSAIFVLVFLGCAAILYIPFKLWVVSYKDNPVGHCIQLVIIYLVIFFIAYIMMVEISGRF